MSISVPCDNDLCNSSGLIYPLKWHRSTSVGVHATCIWNCLWEKIKFYVILKTSLASIIAALTILA